MPDENTQPNTEPAPTPPETQNSESNSAPVSPQEPTAEAPVPPIESTSPLEPLRPTETQPSPEEAIPVNNDIPAPPSPEATAGQGNESLTQKRKENLERANLKRQGRKRERINEILGLFAERQKITNDEVEKLLHVSDATATRYLKTLEKEGKIKQVGKTGKGVMYEKI